MYQCFVSRGMITVCKSVCMQSSMHNYTFSTMYGCIKGTDSTITPILQLHHVAVCGGEITALFGYRNALDTGTARRVYAA